MHRLPFVLALALCGCEARQPIPTDAHNSARAGPEVAPMPVDVEARLRGCIGKTVAEVVETLGLNGIEPILVDEPPGVLRGISYFDGRQPVVTLYFAETEPLHRKFSERRDWDTTLIPKCRVGGIQYSSCGGRFDIGPAIPWQWRPTRDD